jgi:hypothetical protein
MRSTVGVLLVASGALVGAQGLARWPADGPPAVALADIPIVELPMPAPQAHRESSVAEDASLASPPTRSATDGPVAARDPGRPRRPEAMPAATPHHLARELQQALRRAHCYGGPINGVWTAETRRAMSAFLARANATLPVDKPDAILLALLQNEPDARCGSCPPGQQPGADGACLAAGMSNEERLPRSATPSVAPTAELFRSAREPAGAVAAPSGHAAPHPAAPPIAGRMSIGGPRLATAELPRPRAFTPTGPQGATAPRHRRAHRFTLAHHHRRPMRFVYRPARGVGGMVGWLLGGWQF